MTEFTFQPRPDREVRQYFANKGAQPAFSWLDVWGEEHALAFTVAKATELKVLNTIRESLQKAMDEGVPFSSFKRDLTPRLQKLGWWGKKPMADPKTGGITPAQLGSPRRLKTIYRANIRAARSAGQWQRAQRTKRAMPYFIYTLGPSEVHRPDHAAKSGLVLPVDHPFWATWMPPNGWGCKCRVRQISRAEAIRRGGVSQAPDVPMRAYRNKRTGVVTQIPQGIDPGWHSNPGLARARNLARHLAGEIDKAFEPARRVAVKDLAGSYLMRRVLEARPEKGALFAPLAVLDDAAVAALGGKTRVAMLSNADGAKQKKKRPELTLDDYSKLQGLIDGGSYIRQGDRDMVFYAQLENKWWVAVLRYTKAGDELFVKSLRRSRPGWIDRLKNRHLGE